MRIGFIFNTGVMTMATMQRRRRRDEQQAKAVLSQDQIKQSVAALSAAFSKATDYWPAHKNHKGTELYNLQIDFCWIMREITDGPVYIVPARIQEANELIAKANKLQRDRFGSVIYADETSPENFS